MIQKEKNDEICLNRFQINKIKISAWLKMLQRKKKDAAKTQKAGRKYLQIVLIKDFFQNIKRTQNETRNIENG